MHTPVLLHESLAALAIDPAGTYVDLTFGGGGHARAVLDQLREGGRLLAFDQDPAAALVAARVRHPGFTFVQANARFVKQFLAFRQVGRVDGILADLGVSSYQIDTAARGFSTREEGVLDMRMNPATTLTAQVVVNTYSAAQLQWLLLHYGEVRNARTVARAIVAARAVQPICTTHDLCGVLRRWAPRGREAKFYAKVFQAFRIEVNDELGALRAVLQQSVGLLRPGGRLVVLSYHSLEDRLVKYFLRAGNFEGVVQRDVYGRVVRPFSPVCRKPMVPSAQELVANPRARSAKLRAGVLEGAGVL